MGGIAGVVQFATTAPVENPGTAVAALFFIKDA
jgi:hypothetical protein